MNEIFRGIPAEAAVWAAVTAPWAFRKIPAGQKG